MVQLRQGVMLQVYKGSIIDCYTDAVVIPVTTTLEWDPQVATELERKAGLSTLERARRKAPLKLGEAVVTPGGGLLAGFIIFVAVPSIVTSQDAVSVDRLEILETVAKNSLVRCIELGIPSIGLPNLGRWLGFSPEASAFPVLSALHRNVPEGGGIDEIHVVMRDSAELAAFEKLLAENRA